MNGVCLSHAQRERDGYLTQGECINGPRGTLSSRGHLVRRYVLLRSRRCETLGSLTYRYWEGTFSQTPLVLPIRGHLDAINRLMTGDFEIGRGSRQRSLKRIIYCNTHKVSAVGRDRAIEMFKEDLSAGPTLLARLWTLSGLRLVCHCSPNQRCHGDILIQKFTELYPSAFDRSSSVITPDSATLNYLAALREEPLSDQGSSADEGAPSVGSGWTGIGSPMTVGTGVHGAPLLRRPIFGFAGALGT